MARPSKYSPELRRRAIADAGLEVGPTTEELAEIRKLRKEVADQQRTIEMADSGGGLFIGQPLGRPRTGTRSR